MEFIRAFDASMQRIKKLTDYSRGTARARMTGFRVRETGERSEHRRRWTGGALGCASLPSL
jgi:hypothetical protein